jgi:phosphocarrier protein HPr
MERQVTVSHAEGLHARPAAEFAKAAARFQCKVEVVVGSQTVNARSILSLLTLGVKNGQAVVIRAEGEDAEAALNHLVGLLEPAV